MYVLLYKPLYVIYCKELAHVIWSLIPEICKLKTQESRWDSSGPKAIDRLKTQEKPLFQFKSESRKKLMSKFEGCQVGGILLLKGEDWLFWFYSGLQLIRWGPPTLGSTLLSLPIWMSSSSKNTLIEALSSFLKSIFYLGF